MCAIMYRVLSLILPRQCEVLKTERRAVRISTIKLISAVVRKGSDGLTAPASQEIEATEAGEGGCNDKEPVNHLGVSSYETGEDI